jgi:TolB-like protein/Tfp pilus assembly protein PilF
VVLVPDDQGPIDGAARPTARPHPHFTSRRLQNAAVTASVLATLGIWAAAGWAWLEQTWLAPPAATEHVFILASPQKPAKVSAQTPTETSAHTQTEMSAQTPTEVSSQRPTEVSAESPTAIHTASNSASNPSPPVSIAVLPFANLLNDPDQEYLADAITADLISDLSRIAGSFVIAPATAFTYQDRAADAVHVGQELAVRYIAEGQVRWAGDQLRVIVWLIDGETGSRVWADQVDTDRAHLSKMEGAIVGRLARALNLEMAEPAESERATDPDARNLIMKGWAWCRRPYSTATWQQARQAFEQALQIDPSSVDARIGLATVLGGRLADGWSGATQLDAARAEHLLHEALDRDANNSMAHFAIGVIRQMQDRLSEAKIEYEAAVALDPNDARAYFHLGQMLMFLADPTAAMPNFEKALRLSPRDPNIAHVYWALGTSQLLLGQVDNAIGWLQQARAANPRLWFPQLYLAGAFGLQGQMDEAKAALAQSIKLNPNINSLARMRSYNPWITNPQHWMLQESTLNIGLRRAGFHDG